MFIPLSFIRFFCAYPIVPVSSGNSLSSTQSLQMVSAGGKQWALFSGTDGSADSPVDVDHSHLSRIFHNDQNLVVAVPIRLKTRKCRYFDFRYFISIQCKTQLGFDGHPYGTTNRSCWYQRLCTFPTMDTDKVVMSNSSLLTLFLSTSFTINYRGSVYRTCQVLFSSLLRLTTISTMHTMNPMATIGPVVLIADLINAPEINLGVLYTGSLAVTVNSLISCSL